MACSGGGSVGFGGFGGANAQAACSAWAGSMGLYGRVNENGTCQAHDGEATATSSQPMACGGPDLSAIETAKLDAASIAALVFLVMLVIAVHRYYRRAL